MPGKKEISLLPNEVNQNTPLARLLHWLTTVGRFIIVFTELIVISAFISRFWLDRKNSDLSEIIRQQKAILASTSNFEKEYSSLQSRLKYIDTFYQNRPDYQTQIKKISGSLPPDIYFENFTIGQDEKNPKILTAYINLYTYREDLIVEFITNLTANPSITNLNVQKIEKKAKDSRYYIDVSLSLKSNE
jgi:hypothetical protein